MASCVFGTRNSIGWKQNDRQIRMLGQKISTWAAKALDASLEKGLKKPWFEVHHEHVF